MVRFRCLFITRLYMYNKKYLITSVRMYNNHRTKYLPPNIQNEFICSLRKCVYYFFFLKLAALLLLLLCMPCCPSVAAACCRRSRRRASWPRRSFSTSSRSSLDKIEAKRRRKKVNENQNANNFSFERLKEKKPKKNDTHVLQCGVPAIHIVFYCF